MTRSSIIILLVSACFSLSCNQPFDPRGPLDRRMVVFTVLSTDRSQQFVRLEHSYMPDGFDVQATSTDESIAGATVTMAYGGTTYQFHDTSLTRTDTSRYTFPIHAYVTNRFVPVNGRTYQVTVKAPEYGSFSSSISIPYKPYLQPLVTTLWLLDAQGSDSTSELVFPVYTAKGQAYISHLYVYYDVLRDNEWVEERTEIPVSFLYTGGEDYNYPVYPSITVTSTIGTSAGVYRNKMYLITLSLIANRKYANTKLIFNRAVFTVLQFEKNLYNYFITVHGYRDPHSIRLDDPGFTNVPRGQGVIGAYTIDSLVHPFPEYFGFNRR